MKWLKTYQPGDQLTSQDMNRLSLVTLTFGIFLALMLVWNIVLTFYLREAHKTIDTTQQDLITAGLEFHNRMNEMESAHFAELNRIDKELVETQHDLEVAQSQLEIVDSAINGREKRQVRINKVIAAIKDTLPEYRSTIEGCGTAPSPGELWSIAGAIVDNADEYAVPASLIAAVIKQESAFCNEAVSGVGAKGYMQLMPETAAEVSADVAVKTGRALRTWRGRDNIQLGTAYLSAMLLEFNGDVKLAAGAYNAGPTHVKKVLAGLIEERTCKSGVKTKFYCETEDYMDKVMQNKQEYDKLGLN